MSAKTLREAAAVLLAEADRLDGVPPDYYGTNLADPRASWELMLRQFAERKKPHEWRDWKPGMLPTDAGDNVPESPLYESHKTFWSAMEREGVKDLQGVRFSSISCRKRGGWKDFEDNVRFLWSNADGIKWRADPLNAPILPKTAP